VWKNVSEKTQMGKPLKVDFETTSKSVGRAQSLKCTFLGKKDNNKVELIHSKKFRETCSQN
jgi:hypothetical protein